MSYTSGFDNLKYIDVDEIAKECRGNQIYILLSIEQSLYYSEAPSWQAYYEDLLEEQATARKLRSSLLSSDFFAGSQAYMNTCRLAVINTYLDFLENGEGYGEIFRAKRYADNC